MENIYMCVNCGGGFPRNEMCMNTEYDSDFCDDCYPQENDIGLTKEYSVWVGGTEVNDNYLTKQQASELAELYISMGYDDVTIGGLMKEYYADVRIAWGTSFEAENKDDFVAKLKEQFKQDYNIELADKEIHNIQGGK